MNARENVTPIADQPRHHQHERARRILDVIAEVFVHFGLMLRIVCAGVFIVMMLHQQVVPVSLSPIP